MQYESLRKTVGNEKVQYVTPSSWLNHYSNETSAKRDLPDFRLNNHLLGKGNQVFTFD